jgi:hypothetical protein
MEVRGHAFVTIGVSVDVQKWNWPDYLMFSKGVCHFWWLLNLYGHKGEVFVCVVKDLAFEKYQKAL